jgi:hypothetical protein
MDDLTQAILNNPDDSASLQDDADDLQTPDAGPSTGSGSGSAFKRHVLKRSIFKAASMQDKLLER